MIWPGLVLIAVAAYMIAAAIVWPIGAAGLVAVLLAAGVFIGCGADLLYGEWDRRRMYRRAEIRRPY